MVPTSEEYGCTPDEYGSTPGKLWVYLSKIFTFKEFHIYIERERGYYTVARRYEIYFRVVKYCFCHEKIKFISSSHRVMFFLLYRQNDIDKIIKLQSPMKTSKQYGSYL